MTTLMCIKTERKTFIPILASPRRPPFLYERHREEDPRGLRRPQGQHARLPELGEEDRRHPESVSATRRETLICAVL